MVCPQCQRELFVDGDDTIGECPYCHFEFITTNSSASGDSIGFSKPESAGSVEKVTIENPPLKSTVELSLEEKGAIFHFLSFALIVIQYLICIWNPFESGLGFGPNHLLVGIPIFIGMCVWTLKGGFAPTVLFTGYNIIAVCYIISTFNFADLKFTWLLFVANALLFTPASFAFRERNRKVAASLVCPYCASEVENPDVTVCARCGRSIKYVDGENPAFVKDEVGGCTKSTGSYCTACGSKRVIGAKFCGNCGHQFE